MMDWKLGKANSIFNFCEMLLVLRSEIVVSYDRFDWKGILGRDSV